MIYRCDAFLKLTIAERTDRAKQKGLCLNCLKKSHCANECRSTTLCKHCKRKHHSLLHIYEKNEPKTVTKVSNNQPINDKENDKCEIFNILSTQTFEKQILLSTASVLIKDSNGREHKCRILLDGGSQANFITRELQSKLNLPVSKTNSIILGINQTQSNITLKTQVELRSRINAYKINTHCLVVPNITEQLPFASFPASSLQLPRNISLADPEFNVKGKIDLLIGASVFWQLLSIGQISLGNNLPILQKTRFGWLVSGPLPVNPARKLKVVCNFSQNLEIDLERFWDIQNYEEPRKLSKNEQFCEEHFVNTTQRDETGRFIVSFPLKETKLELGDTRNKTIKRFYSLEKRLEHEPQLKQNYIEFMREYQSLGHMIPINEYDADLVSYIPHHAVIKDSSTTTKTRVVFDASMKSDTNLSLNDIQYAGPVVQNELFIILIRFREHRYVITGDIEKMYRQILICKNERPLQRIFWRENPTDDLRCFELQTITYGTTAAPYLATRCIKQISQENKSSFPRASEAINEDMYVDDFLSGENSIDKLIKLKQDVTSILASAGLNLRKWRSNVQNLSDLDNTSNKNLSFEVSSENKILGIYWNSISDSITYTVKRHEHNAAVTKRTILSIIAQIFDPLGLLTPVIIVAKLIMQELWQARLSWDESLPNSLHMKWLKFHDGLNELNNLEIPRGILISNYIDIQLHGFADSSEVAFGTCIYVRSKASNNDNYNVRLLCAKSRVAPLRKISLPRLELCAAVLLSELMLKIKNSLNYNVSSIYYWSDSKIVICWINSSCQQWQTFVANRIATIQRTSNPRDWLHVKSDQNPADLITRGMKPSQIKAAQLWWNGPSWLSQNQTNWPINDNEPDLNLKNVPEYRARKTVFLTLNNEFELFQRYPCLTKLKRIVALILDSTIDLKVNSPCDVDICQ